jgi:TolB-like protein/class 3 adenylate cyclase/Flp pilus assembly protein TadD
MNNQLVKRRLAAILSADVKGYSRLMGDDEEATIRTLTAYRAVMTTRIQQERGRVVDAPGDNLLAEFASVVEAVRCAVELQQEVKTRNAELPPQRQMEFRIGINLGDVVVEGDEIYGDGVNIAARLESLAEPGGICISGTVYDQIKNKLSLEYKSLGEQAVKNIAEPVRAYYVSPAPSESGGAQRWQRLRKILGPWAWIAPAAAALLLVVGVATWDIVPTWLVSKATQIIASPSRLTLPDKPSIAVLAFDNMSMVPGQDYFSDGVSEDIITDLARVPGLFVIARNSSFAYKGRSVSVREIGRQLGVRYILEGSIRRSGDTVRINAQLADAQTGLHIWSSRFDRQLDELFKVQDQISNEIVQALAIQLTQRDEGTSARGSENSSAYDAFLRGWAKYRTGTRLSITDALQDFRRAIELDPTYGRAHAALAATYVTMLERDWYDIGEKPDPFQYRMERRARRSELRSEARKHLALAMTQPSPLALRASARLLSHEGEYEKAIQQMVSAIAMDPNDADSYAQLGLTLTWAGRASEGLDPIEKAIRLDPQYPPYVANLGIANFALGNYPRAAELLERSADLNPADHWPLIHLISAYGYLGKRKEAAKTIDALNRLLGKAGHADFSVRFTRLDMPYRYETDRLRLLVGLKKSGIPDFRGETNVSPI